MSITFRNRSAAILGLLGCGFCAVFAARLVEARKALDAEAQKRVAAAISQGRKLAGQGKNPEAIAAFQSALSIDPTTAKALSELGLAYYQMKQYPEGEAAMRKAIKAAAEPGQRGRSLYNLGLILEAKGDAKGAVTAYQASLKERTNQVVLERLRKLDAAAAAALDPVAPRSLRGPFLTLPELCKAVNDCKKRAAEELSSAGEHYSCKVKKPLAAVAKPAAPYKAVQLIETVCAETEEVGGNSDTRVYLVVQNDKGWFATDVGGHFANSNTSTFSDFNMKELQLTAGAAGAQRIFLRFAENASHEMNTGSDAWENEKLVIAGIGKSGTPSATPPLLLRTLETEDPGDYGDDKGGKDSDKTIVNLKAKLNINLQGDELELTPATSAKSVAKAHLAPTGKHALMFP